MDIGKGVLLRIDNILRNDDNPFIRDYYRDILKIKKVLKKIIKKLEPYKKYYDFDIKNIIMLDNLLKYGWYNDNFSDVLNEHLNILISYLEIIEELIQKE